jgi:hypothetical protein
MTTKLTWTTESLEGTSLRGYLDNTPYRFEELVARLRGASSQDPTTHTDGYKTSVEFVGAFNGQPFSLYDYKGDMTVHIGGTDRLNVEALKAALLDAVNAAEPVAYEATLHYDELRGRQHSY